VNTIAGLLAEFEDAGGRIHGIAEKHDLFLTEPISPVTAGPQCNPARQSTGVPKARR
jgi:hypothetical protein